MLYSYYLLFLIHVDINECSDENGGCSEVCINTEGSYYCACNDSGYEVIENSEPCQGKQAVTTVQYLCYKVDFLLVLSLSYYVA